MPKAAGALLSTPALGSSDPAQAPACAPSTGTRQCATMRASQRARPLRRAPPRRATASRRSRARRWRARGRRAPSRSPRSRARARAARAPPAGRAPPRLPAHMPLPSPALTLGATAPGPGRHNDVAENMPCARALLRLDQLIARAPQTKGCRAMHGEQPAAMPGCGRCRAGRGCARAAHCHHCARTPRTSGRARRTAGGRRTAKTRAA